MILVFVGMFGLPLKARQRSTTYWAKTARDMQSRLTFGVLGVYEASQFEHTPQYFVCCGSSWAAFFVLLWWNFQNDHASC